MGPFAWDKMVLIFLVVLVLFGPKELPKVARTIAKFMNDFKRASSELKETWQRELSALEHETQDIRKELDISTDLTQTSAGYTESGYHHDSSYDYGSYGYPDSSTEVAAAGSVAAAAAAAEPAAEAAAEAVVEGPAAETAEETESAPAAVEAMPVIAAAQGTVPTDVATTPAADAHDEPAASL
jgi:TatA/E family protein of Tat protein translocase